MLKLSRPFGRSTASSSIAFGPFMITGALAALFFGSAISELYTTFAYGG